MRSNETACSARAIKAIESCSSAATDDVDVAGVCAVLMSYCDLCVSTDQVPSIEKMFALLVPRDWRASIPTVPVSNAKLQSE
jgi:hypothetical protein